MATSAPAGQEDRRAAGPRPQPQDGAGVTCHKGVLGLGPDLAVGLLNLSDTGVALLVSQTLRERDLVEVGLRAPGWTRPVHRLGLVVWSQPTEAGPWRVGVLFARGLGVALHDL